MIQTMVVRGEFERVMQLNTSVEHAYNYFSDFSYVLPRLPEVSRIIRYRDGRYRMVFSADDGRGHEMSIVFDIKHQLTQNRHIKMLAAPLTIEHLRADKMMHATNPIFPGVFNGEVLFLDKVTHTEVIYRVNLLIEIEVPRFLAFMPKNVLQSIGDTMMRMKLNQVTEGFANKVVADFSEWYVPYQAKKQEIGVAQSSTLIQTRAQTHVPTYANDKAVPLISTVSLPQESTANGLN